MKRDLSILSEYVRISTPDKDRLAELVVRAKGPELSMSQFAKKCEVNPSTLSRIVNKKTTGKNSEYLILLRMQIQIVELPLKCLCLLMA